MALRGTVEANIYLAGPARGQWYREQRPRSSGEPRNSYQRETVSKLIKLQRETTATSFQRDVVRLVGTGNLKGLKLRQNVPPLCTRTAKNANCVTLSFGPAPHLKTDPARIAESCWPSPLMTKRHDISEKRKVQGRRRFQLAKSGALGLLTPDPSCNDAQWREV